MAQDLHLFHVCEYSRSECEYEYKYEYIASNYKYKYKYQVNLCRHLSTYNMVPARHPNSDRHPQPKMAGDG